MSKKEKPALLSTDEWMSRLELEQMIRKDQFKMLQEQAYRLMALPIEKSLAKSAHERLVARLQEKMEKGKGVGKK